MCSKMLGEKTASLFPQGLRGIIFDCDGVLLDSRAANKEYYNRILAHFQLPPMTDEQERYSFMATARQSLEHMLPKKLHADIDYVTQHVVIYSRDIAPLLRLYEGTRSFLDTARQCGMQLAVQTNRRKDGMQTVLDIFGLQPYFCPVVTATEVAPKPSPEGIYSILAQWQAEPRQVLFVGDSVHDHDAARAAGVPFAALHAQDLEGDITAGDFFALGQALRPTLENA